MTNHSLRDAQRLKVPLSISNFRELREGNFYYVDKSQFIVELANTSSKVLLLPRPRRFGKTLNLTTLQTWYERLPEGETYTHLLDGLKADISDGEHQKKRGKLPVVFLTFKDIKEKTWIETKERIVKKIADEVLRLEPWWKNFALDPIVRDQLMALKTSTPSAALLNDALELLTRVLALVSGEQVMLLVDEYDTPVQAGLLGGYFEDVVSFMRNFLSAGLKDNSFIYKGVLTGILRVSKENLFSGLNNIDVCQLTRERFDTCFGLLPNEVKELLSNAQLEQCFEEVKKWYNGYLFGRNTLYNPWSVLSFVSDPVEGCKPHWVNTGDTALLVNAITNAYGFLEKDLGVLLEGGSIEKIIDDHVTYSKDGIRPTDIWSFLLYTGYLKLISPLKQRERRMWGSLAIPNSEVLLAFEVLVSEWAATKLGANNEVSDMLHALVEGRIADFEEAFKSVVMNALSFHDLKRSQTESFYHAFVTGILVGLNNTHIVRSNRESGMGRYDVMLLPKDVKKFAGVVMEFKIVNSNESPQVALSAAHQQIIDKKYDTELKAHGCMRIFHWAIAFRGKDVFLSLQEKV